MASHSLHSRATALFVVATFAAAPAGAQTIGKVGAVNPAAQSAPPGGSLRTIQLGTQIIYKERISTSASGSLQLAFTDKSTLSLGPNSDLVIDEFVYDPNSGQGKMAVSLGRGVLRFVGGQVSHDGNAQIKTPVATIGLRGAAGTISYDPAGSGTLKVISSYGQFRIETPQGVQTIQRPNFVSTVTGGSEPSSPVKASQADLDTTTRATTSSPSQSGSAPRKPTDDVARSIVGGETARTDPVTVVQAAGNTSQSVADGPSQVASQPPNTTQTTQTTTQTTAITTTISQTGGGSDTSALSTVRARANNAVAASSTALSAAILAYSTASTAATVSIGSAGQANTDSASTNAANTATASLTMVAAANTKAQADLSAAQVALQAAMKALSTVNSATTLLEAQTASTAVNAALANLTTIMADLTMQTSAGQAAATNYALAVKASNIAPARAFSFNVSAGAGSTVPYLTGAFVGTNGPAATITPLMGYRTVGTVAADGLSATPGFTRTLQVGLVINGQGSAQTSGLLASTGTFSSGSTSGNPLDYLGGFFASSRQASTSGSSYARGNVTSTDSSMQVDTNNIATTFGVDPTSLAGGKATSPGPASEFGGPVASNRYTYAQTVTQTAPAATLGSNRALTTLQGYTSGIMTSSLLSTTTDANGFRTGVAGSSETYSVAGAADAPSDVSITLDPSTSLGSATIRLKSNSTTSRLRTATYEFGTLNPNADLTRSAYIDSNNWAVRTSSDRPSTATTMTESGAQYATQNAAALVPWSAIAYTNPNAAATYFPGVNICACSYLSWGFWSLTPERLTQSSAYYDTDRGNLIPWVAGQLASASQLGTTGSATYAGHAIANINNAGAQYIAGGNFSSTVNFGTGTGTLAITALDGRDYTGGLSNVPNSANFAGSISTTGLTGQVNGSYYGIGTPPAEMGGQFRMGTSGSTYFGAGIFAAKR